MSQQDLFSTPEFQRLHPVKQQIIREMSAANNNETPENILARIMTVNKELSKRNLNFTKEESALLIQIMKQSLSPSDKQKVDLLMGLFQR